MSQPDLRCAYSTALASIDVEERKQIQNLVTSDHNAIFSERNEKPSLRLGGLCEAIKGFENIKRVVAVYFDGWTYEELERGANLILWRPPRAIALRYLFRASYRPENYCSCVKKVVDQLEKSAFDGASYYDIQQAQDKLATLSLKTTPVIESRVVCTPHVMATLNGGEKADVMV